MTLRERFEKETGEEGSFYCRKYEYIEWLEQRLKKAENLLLESECLIDVEFTMKVEKYFKNIKG